MLTHSCEWCWQSGSLPDAMLLWPWEKQGWEETKLYKRFSGYVLYPSTDENKLHDQVQRPKRRVKQDPKAKVMEPFMQTLG